MNTPTTHPLDKYTEQALEIIGAAIAAFKVTKRDNENPRWLIALDNGKVESSQGGKLSGTIAVDPVDLPKWRELGPDGYTGEQWFRALKHAYLDALALPGGMPKDHPLRDRRNKVLPVSAQAAATIAATVPAVQAPVPVPTAPAPIPAKATKDGPPTPETIRDLIDASEYDQAAALAMQTAGIRLSFTLSDTKPCPWDATGRDGYRPHWRVQVASKTGRTIVDYFDSLNAGKDGAPEPSAYSLIACLSWADPGTFEQFCSEYGYDQDSRNAEKTWKAVRKQFLSLGRVVINEQDRELLAAIS